MQGANQSVVEGAIAGRLEDVDLPENVKQLLEFVRLLTSHSYKNSPDEIRKLREVGWSDPQIAEAVMVVGMFSMFNRVADAFGLEDPNYFEKEKTGKAIRPATRPE